MGSIVFLVALAATGLMGFANQRGGTCTVAAIEEIVDAGRFNRLNAMLEAALWVAGGLLVLGALDLLPPLPAAQAIGTATIAGGVVFGLGAFVNRACIFGTVARLGSGEWAYLATPVGFFFGSLAGRSLSGPLRPDESSIYLSPPVWLAVLLSAAVAARVAVHAKRPVDEVDQSKRFSWSPHLATSVIGVTFLIALVTAGTWTYSEVLSDAVRGRVAGERDKIFLNLSLLGGAVAGGWAAGKLRLVAPDFATLARLLAGGVVMGIGSALIPGGNTALLLIGIPLLQPHAWAALFVIGLTIYIAVRLSRV